MCDWQLSSVPGDGPQRDQAATAVLGGTAFVFGGRDASGSPTNSFLALDLSDESGTWRPVLVASGKPPSARWGASCFAFGEQLWVFGGTAGAGKRFSDLWRFSPATLTWTEVAQHGLPPQRTWNTTSGFDRVVVSGGTLIAFGEPQDENRDPSKRPAAAGAGALPYALDLCSGCWTQLPTAGGLSFDHLESLVAVGGRLVAVGWQTPRAGRKDDTPMQAATLDLASALRPGGDYTVNWVKLSTRGHVPSARASCASALLAGAGGCSAGLLIHGGVLCSPSVQGMLTSDAYVLDLDICSWTKLAPAMTRTFGQAALNQPRINHCALAVHHAQGVLIIGGTSSIGCFASCPSIELLSQQGASPAGHSLQGTLPCLLAAATGSTSPTAMAAMAGASPLILSATPALVPSHDLRPFYLSENLSDIILVVGDAALPAHRLVLAVSPRFCELMEQAASFTKPVDRKWKIHLTDVWPDVLKLMLAHMYGCLEAVPFADAATLFSAATRYGLAALRAECLRVLCATTTIETVSTHVLLAFEQQCTELMQACVTYAAASKERFSQMLSTPGYLHLTEASPKVGQLFLQQAMQELLRKA